MRERLRVGVLFGGRSGEHEVSLQSAKSVIDAMDPERYEVVPIGITKEGRWLASSDATLLLPEAVMREADRSVALFGDPTRDGLVRIDGEDWTARSFDDDTVIPEGAAVSVMRISGTTAYVYPLE